jgi:hypothetical protein
LVGGFDRRGSSRKRTVLLRFRPQQGMYNTMAAQCAVAGW